MLESRPVSNWRALEIELHLISLLFSHFCPLILVAENVLWIVCSACSCWASGGLLPVCWCCGHNRAVVDSPHCRMHLSDRAQRVLFDQPTFFLRSRQQCRRWSSTEQCMSSVSVESYVEQRGKGCVSICLATWVFPAFWPLGTVDWWGASSGRFFWSGLLSLCAISKVSVQLRLTDLRCQCDCWWHHDRSSWGWGCSSRQVRWLWMIWPIGRLLLCRLAWKTAFLLNTADGIELSLGLIAGQPYWWRCELMGEFIGNYLGV